MTPDTIHKVAREMDDFSGDGREKWAKVINWWAERIRAITAHPDTHALLPREPTEASQESEG